MKKTLPPKLLTALLLGLILCAAFSLRACDLDRGSLWEDEYHGVDRALMEPARMFQVQKYQGPSNTSFDLQPPLFYAVERLAFKVDKTAYAGRMVSVMAGILCIAALYFLGKRLFGQDVGFYAAILLTFSIFHMNISRTIKPYSLFFLFYVSALLFLLLALERKTFVFYACYALAATGMLYASFIGVPAFASHGLAAALFFYRERAAGVPGRALLRRIARALLAFLAVGVLFLPMLGGVIFLRDFLYEPGAVAILNLSAKDCPGLVSGFFFQYFEPNAFWWTLYPLAILTGVAACLIRKRGFQLLFLSICALTPLIAAFLGSTKHVLENRHLPTLYPFILLMLACAISLCARFAAGFAASRASKTALSALLGAGLVLLLSFPGLSALDGFHGKSISNDKQMLHYLASNKNNIDYLDFQGFQSHPKRVAAKWYLPGLFSPFSPFDPAPYKRCYVVCNALDVDTAIKISPYAKLFKNIDVSIFHTDIYVTGLLNRSPLAIDPVRNRFEYAEDFTSYRMFSDCRQSRNAALDLERGLLTPLDVALPAEVVYMFTPPQNVSIASVKLTLDATLYKRNPKRGADSTILVSTSRDGKTYAQAGRIDFADFLDANGEYVPVQCPFYLIYFNSKCKTISKEYALPAQGGAPLYVRLSLVSGQEEGNMVIDAFRLFIETSGAPEPGADLLADALKNVSQNACLAKWTDEATLALSDCVHAFDLTDRLGCESPEASCNPSADLAKYAAVHPDAAPIYALADRDGKPGVAFYDPALADPFIRLSSAKPSVRIDRGTSAPLAVKSLKITGRLDAPDFTVDGRRVAIPVIAPGGSTLVLNAGGEGRLYLNPVFTKKSYDPDSFLNSYNMARNDRPGEDGCLTCGEDYRCFFTYSVISAFPIREAFIESHLRTFMDAAKTNGAKVLVSTGDEHFVPIEEFSSDGSGIWKYSDGRARVLTFETPVSALKIRVELTGQGAQIWSTDRPIDDMRITCKLDARAFKPFAIEKRFFDLALEKPGANRTGFFFSGAPERFFDDLRRYH